MAWLVVHLLLEEAYNSGGGEEWLLASTPLQDLRGRTSLIELAGACREARAVVSVDAGPLHIAAAVGTPTFAVVGNTLMVLALVRTFMAPSSVKLFSIGINIYLRQCSLERFRNDDCR